MIDLQTNIGNCTIQNPVITASGTFAYGIEASKLVNLNTLGAISIKGLHINKSTGNPPQRIFETPSGMLNAIGLEGIGIEAFIKNKLPLLEKYKCSIIVNFWGKTQTEYELAIIRLNDIKNKIHALEVNVSCPNIKEGGISFGTDKKALAKLTASLKKRSKLPLIVKLSPNVNSIKEMAKIVEQEGADAISLINTFPAMAIDIEKQKPVLSNITGGLSGPAIKPIALKMVWEAASSVKIPVIGIGGIMNANDAIEFIIAGASAIQIGTANFIDPLTPIKVIEGIKKYCKKHNIQKLSSLIGCLKCKKIH